MSRYLLAASLSIALIAPASAQNSTLPEFTPEQFKSHVTFLSSDLLEGRGTGTRGHEVAASYVASQFEGLGLKPGGEDGGWYQRITFRSASLGPEKPKVTITGAAGSQSWENATEVVVGPSRTDAVQDVSAPVVFAGYGMDAPSLGLDDYKGLDVRGKIVAVLAGTPDGLSSEINAELGRTKSVMAARHGAIGLITLPTAQSEEESPWSNTIRRAGRDGGLSWVGKDGKSSGDAGSVRITASVHGPAVEALFAGAPRSYADVRAEASRKGALPKGFPLKSNIRITRSSVWSNITSPEVIGVMPGSDPKLKDEYVILMGHLDHLGMKMDAKPGEDAIYNGALDNASGVATMLEVARAFAESGQRPRRSLLFIANTAEERGLLGADYFAQHPTVPIEKVASVVDLDMPLLLYDFTDVIAFGAEHSTIAQTVAKAAGSMGLGLSPDPMPEEGIFVRSDHYMFVRQGVPAVFLATGWANGGDKHWKDFLGGDYHSVRDDLSQPIRWDQGAKFARLNYLISRDLADADQRPLWYKNDFFGDLYAPKMPKAVKAAN